MIREASGTASVSIAVPSPHRWLRQRHSWDVPGGDDERKTEGHLTAGIGQDAGQLEMHRRLLAGHQVADTKREHIGPLFLGNRRALTGRDAWS